jgi:hypothetical protein
MATSIASDEAAPGRAPAAKERTIAAPETPRPAVAVGRVEAPSNERRDEATAFTTDRVEAGVPMESRRSGPMSALAAAVEPLPPGIVAAGTFRGVGADDPLWTALHRAPSKNAWVVGPAGTPFSCAGATVESRDGAPCLVLWAAGTERPVAPGGCLVHLPDGRHPVCLEIRSE